MKKRKQKMVTKLFYSFCYYHGMLMRPREFHDNHAVSKFDRRVGKNVEFFYPEYYALLFH